MYIILYALAGYVTSEVIH